MIAREAPNSTRVRSRSVRAWEAGREPVRPAIAEQLRDLDAEHRSYVTQMAGSELVEIPRRADGGGWYIAALARTWATNPGVRAVWAGRWR